MQQSNRKHACHCKQEQKTFSKYGACIIEHYLDSPTIFQPLAKQQYIGLHFPEH